MKKRIGQETIDVYADACDRCGQVTHQSGVALRIQHQVSVLLFCYACAPDLLERINDLPTCEGTIQSTLNYSDRPA